MKGNAFGKRTISCVTFFGLKPSASAADRCSVESWPIVQNKESESRSMADIQII
jgi:hypothetical protein